MPYNSTRWIGSTRIRIPDNLDRTGEARFAYEIAERAAAANRPLLIIGEVGVGKTTLMAFVERAILRSLKRKISERTRCAWIDDPSWWTTSTEWVADVRQGWTLAKRFRDDWGPAYDARGLSGMAHRLFFDDLGTEKLEAVDTINELIDERYRRELPTWITTNLEDDQLVERYGRRTVSRLLHRNEVLYVLGNDRRTPYG